MVKFLAPQLLSPSWLLRPKINFVVTEFDKNNMMDFLKWWIEAVISVFPRDSYIKLLASFTSIRSMSTQIEQQVNLEESTISTAGDVITLRLRGFKKT